MAVVLTVPECALVDAWRADCACSTVRTPEATIAALPMERASARVRPPDGNDRHVNPPQVLESCNHSRR